MKVLVLGCGNIGSAAAADMARSIASVEVVVADKEKARAKAVTEKIGSSNVSWTKIDVANHDELINSLRKYDIVMGFLPGKLGYKLTEACIEAKRDLVDVSYMEENPLKLNQKALKANVTIIPDCGLAPGISNVLVGHAVGKLDKVKSIGIMVGGLPEKPVPPLGYTITWSPESLIDEYSRKARIVKKGKTVEVEALTGLEEVEFPNFEKLEAFYTDGLRTLLHTIEDAEEMWEKTLRYPGHAQKIGLLKALGFFNEEKVDVEGTQLSPRKLTAKLFEMTLLKPEIKDVVALKVEVSGVKNSKQKRYVYHMLDRYDRKSQMTAMARTTAFPASIVAQLLLKKAIKNKGVVPPEILGMYKGIFEKFSKGLEKKRVKITEEIV